MEPQSPEIIVRYSQKMLTQKRRSNRRYGVFGVIASLCGLAIAYAGYRTHAWIDVGRRNEIFMVPPWAAAFISIAWLVGSIWLLVESRSPQQ